MKKATPDNRISFGDDTFYVSGAGIPEGNYALYFDAVIHQFEKSTGEKSGPEFLTIRVSAFQLDELGADPKIGYYRMGSKAILSFAPNTQDEGKSLIAIPGGPAGTMNDSTNWSLFRKSLRDSGLPPVVFVNDLRVLDGVWAHITHVPEPEERKGFGTGTGEIPELRRNQTIAVVSEILEGGSPWEGGGGMPKGITPKAPSGPTGVVRSDSQTPRVPTTSAATVRVPAQKPNQPEAVIAPEDDDVLIAAQTAAATVLEASPDGLPRLLFKTQIFNAANKTSGGPLAQAILDTYFKDEGTMNAFLSELGYEVKGTRVTPIPL